MADRFYARMEIPERDVSEELKQIIDDEICSPLDEYDRNNGDILSIDDDSAYYGEFPEIEEYCVTHGIPFNRFSSGAYEFDAEWRAFRPEENIDVVIATLEDERPIVPSDPLRKLLREHEDDPVAAVGAVVAYLDAHAPVIPELK